MFSAEMPGCDTVWLIEKMVCFPFTDWLDVNICFGNVRQSVFGGPGVFGPLVLQVGLFK